MTESSIYFHNKDSCTRPKVLGDPQQLETCPRTLFPLVSNSHLEFGLEHVPAQSQVPLHQHPQQTEIIFIHRGQASAQVGDVERLLVEGEVLHVPPRVPHALKNTSMTEPLWFTWTLTPPGRGLVQALEKKEGTEKDSLDLE